VWKPASVLIQLSASEITKATANVMTTLFSSHMGASC
jgi:hypothetical protein